MADAFVQTLKRMRTPMIPSNAIRNDEKARPMEPPEVLLDKSEPPRLRFDLSEDRFDHIHKLVEDWNRGFASETADFSKRYVASKLEVAVELRSLRPQGEQFHLVFCAIPNVSAWHFAKSATADIHTSGECGRANGAQDFVLISDTYFVDGPETLIPSLVWLERAKERVDLFRDICTSTFEVSLECGGIAGEREVSIERFLVPRCYGESVGGVIQGSAKAVNNSPDDIRPDLGNLFRHAELMRKMVGLIRVRLNKNSCVVPFAKPSSAFPIEIGKVLLCPCDLATRTLKGIRHG